MIPGIKRIPYGKSSQPVLAILMIAALVWFARFSSSSRFGLYEDDWTRVPGAVQMGPGELGRFALDGILNFRGQGRPLHQIFIYSLSAIGWAVDGLQGIYLVGYLLVALNGVLFYLLLRRLHSHQLGIVGALAFALYAADSTQAFITHSLGLQPSLTFFLLACHSYIMRKFVLAYVLLVASLLTYETLYFVFLAMPLVTQPWDKRILRPLAIHAAIMAVIFLALYSLRLSVGDIDLDIIRADAQLGTAVRHMVQGPVWNLGSYLYRALETVRSIDLNAILAVSLGFPFFVFVLYRWAIARGEEPPVSSLRLGRELTSDTGVKRPWLPAGSLRTAKARVLLRLLAASAIMLILAYPLTFTTEPYFVFGRVTRNHFSAIVGSSLLVACLWMLATEILRRELPRLAVSVILALCLAFLMGFGQILQRSYVASWNAQKEFWRELFTLASDAGDGAAIVVDSSGLEAGLHIGANSWNMPRVLEAILEFPSHWQVPPSAYRMNDGWMDYLDAGGGRLVMGLPAANSPGDHVRTVSSADMILIITDGGVVARQDSPIQTEGHSYPLRPRGEPILASLERRPLFDLLMNNAAE
jgi:hypothetical protein